MNVPHWKHEAIHALVVTDETDEAVWINDPVLPSGLTAVPIQAFVRAWAATGHITLVITPAEK